MTHDEAFAEFHARRTAERAAEAAARIGWRRARLPGQAPGDPLGYVAWRAEDRSYALPRPDGGYDVGRMDGRKLADPVVVASSLKDAREVATDLVRP